KSTLAYHILYTEGQRRYVETFSPYSRQFLERLDKPDADKIEGIPPALAIEAGTVVKSSRSTVGTLTELTSYFKLLFARAAIAFCPKCSIPVVPQEPQNIVDDVRKRIKGTILLVAFPATKPTGVSHDRWKELLVSNGFSRFWLNGQINRLDASALPPQDTIWIVLDRLKRTDISTKRLIDSLTQAYRFGKGRLALIDENGTFYYYTSGKECPVCGFVPPPQHENLFSFNSPVGACPECRGFGKVIDIDINLAIPDPGLSIRDGAVKPFRTKRRQFNRLINFCLKEGIPIDVPFEDLPDEYKKAIIDGKGRYPGIKGFFRKLTRKSYKLHVRVFLSRFRTYLPCPKCGGTRFQPQSLLFRVHDRTIADYYRMPILELHREFSTPWEEEQTNLPLATLLSQIRHRLNFLVDIGLGYLTLERQSRTLSGGEIQRLHLTRALGSELVNLLYILDEPTIGLHPRDHDRLYKLLRTLVARGNTAIIVDHEPEIVKRCDLLLDLGPGGGENGGQIMYLGPPTKLRHAKNSITAKYLFDNGHPKRSSVSTPKKCSTKWIEVLGASEHNLKNINVKIPLDSLVCITGVSGSGKSTLVEEILYKGIAREKGLKSEKPGRYDKLLGLKNIENVVFIDQHPIGKTPRSNLLTYLNIFSPIRNLFTQTQEAKKLGLKPGDFSFNTPGGRCPVCKGSGYKRIEMQFMADVLETCPACKGARYLGKVLIPRYRGYNIAEVQEIPVQKALETFEGKPGITNPLKLVADLGLDYIKLGQPLDTLSGGEAQRLKLVRFLSKKNKNTLFLMDEPTTGLHPSEIERLSDVLKSLVDSGNTVVVVEHNQQVIKNADWVIDLGPEGGDDGGYIVATGSPSEIMRAKNS
ncbi:MAG: excinuclease ABC subunit A, partial [Deltaproteobacteria bacterium]